MMNVRSYLTITTGLIFSVIYRANCENCITSYHTLKYYEELNCIPTKNEAANCIISFNCSSLFNQKADHCYYRGKEYAVGEELNESDMKSNCIPSCRCLNSYGRASFNCAHVDCPEIFQPPLKQNCMRTYSHDFCCAVGTYCSQDNEENERAKCEYGGKVYLEGSTFYPEEMPCKKCICKPGFNGTLASPWCEDINCEIEIHYADNIQEPCAPVYYGNNSCCPIYFHCHSEDSASEEETNTEESPLTQKLNDNGPKCKFGNITVGVGRKITPPGECIECSCSVPPFVTCVVDGECQEKKRNTAN